MNLGSSFFVFVNKPWFEQIQNYFEGQKHKREQRPAVARLVATFSSIRISRDFISELISVF